METETPPTTSPHNERHRAGGTGRHSLFCATGTLYRGDGGYCKSATGAFIEVSRVRATGEGGTIVLKVH